MKDGANTEMNRAGGLVFHLRLNPKDIMACIDCMVAADIHIPRGMSLSSAMKRGIGIALETLRSSKVIPQRDGFEYSEMIAPFTMPNRQDKIAVGHKMVVQEGRDEIADIPRSRIEKPASERYRITEDDLTRARVRDRLSRQIKELTFKKEADPLNWKKADQQKLNRLEKEIVS